MKSCPVRPLICYFCCSFYGVGIVIVLHVIAIVTVIVCHRTQTIIWQPLWMNIVSSNSWLGNTQWLGHATPLCDTYMGYSVVFLGICGPDNSFTVVLDGTNI